MIFQQKHCHCQRDHSFKMSRIYPNRIYVGTNTPASSIDVLVRGKLLLNLRNLYLSASNPAMFTGTTQYNPFSACGNRIKNAYPAFEAVLIPNFTTISDDIVVFTFPETPKTVGYVDIIAENEAGYGKFTTDTMLPYLSSFPDSVNIQFPWTLGITVCSNPLYPI